MSLALDVQLEASLRQQFGGSLDQIPVKIFTVIPDVIEEKCIFGERIDKINVVPWIGPDEIKKLFSVYACLLTEFPGKESDQLGGRIRIPEVVVMHNLVFAEYGIIGVIKIWHEALVQLGALLPVVVDLVYKWSRLIIPVF